MRHFSSGKPKVDVRIGIHIGDVLMDDRNLRR
jgi:hypothetical protein